MKQRIVIALGGNAIQNKGEKGSHEESYHNIQKTMSEIAKLIKDDNNQVIITHGNGPQVGNILIQNSKGEPEIPAQPMHVCGAESQGQIGYWIQQALINIVGLDQIRPVTIITQVEVDEHDPAFSKPSKPVGPFYTEDESKELANRTGYTFKEDAGRGFRRVVPSPEPASIIEMETIRKLVDTGATVIASGGGGIPVVYENNTIKGVDAVIDKDKAGALLANKLEADLFIILTAVPKVALDFGKPTQTELGTATVFQMEEYLKQGHFAEGSMKPKVEAVLKFVKGDPARRALITSADKLSSAMAGNDGTWVIA